MAKQTTLHRPLISFGLVALQFSFIALLSYLLINQNPSPLTPLQINTVLWLIPAIMLGFWAIKTIKLGKFNVVPDPKQNITLITSGPYRYIRHPMYLSILLFFLPPVVLHPSFSVVFCYALLTLTLLIKLHYEERLLVQKLEAYSHYQTQSKKLIPFLF